MFFLSPLFHPQQKHRMTMAWMAATVGLTKLRKDDIIQLNIEKLCADIIRFMQSNSLDSNKRFSLRLSTMLIHGTVLIYGRQIKFCLDGAYNFLTPNSALDVITSRPKKGPNRVRPKKILPSGNSLTSYEVNIPQETLNQLLNIDETSIRQRADDISIREDEPLRQQNDPENDWFGAQPFPMSSKFDDQVPHMLLQDVQPKEITTEAPEQLPLVEVADVPMSTIIPPSIEYQETNKENELPALPPMQNATNSEQPASEQALTLPTLPPLRAPRKKQNYARTLYVKRSKPNRMILTIVKITRPIELCGDKVIYTEELIKNSDVSLPDFKYFENFWPTPMEQPQIVDNLQGSEISILSGPSDVRNIRSVSGSGSGLNEASTKDTPVDGSRALQPVEIRSTSITPRKRNVDMVETLIEDLPPAAQNGRQNPEKKIKKIPGLPRRLLLKEPEELNPTDASMGLEVEFHERVQIRSQELSSEFGVKWADEIMALLENHSRLSHIEICNFLNAKLNRVNLATIFAALLALAKNGLVDLHSEAESIEFAYAEKSKFV